MLTNPVPMARGHSAIYKGGKATKKCREHYYANTNGLNSSYLFYDFVVLLDIYWTR